MIPVYWDGYGWLVPIIIFVPNFCCISFPTNETLKQGMFIPGMLLAALLLWCIGNFLNFGDLPPFVIDRSKRQLYRETRTGADHRFYFFRIEYWALLPLFVVLTALLYFLRYASQR